MSADTPVLPQYGDDKAASGSIDEKHSAPGVAVGEDAVDDAEMLRQVEEMEDRIAHDDATEGEYFVDKPWEVALKVRHSAWT